MGALQAFVIDSNEALKFRLVRTEEDRDPDNDVDFQPEMTHQIYGEK